MNTLKIKDVSYNYGTNKVLNNISLEINDGITGVLGPNGAGKTTLIKLITTLNSLQEGTIILNGFDYSKSINEVRNHIGYLPQDFSTYGNLKGKEFLEIMSDLKCSKKCSKAEIKNQINEIISLMNMEEYIDKKVSLTLQHPLPLNLEGEGLFFV